jgi:hypothetical protein
MDADWDAFLNTLAEHYAPITDAVMWRLMTKGDREMIWRARELRGANYVALELPPLIY